MENLENASRRQGGGLIDDGTSTIRVTLNWDWSNDHRINVVGCSISGRVIKEFQRRSGGCEYISPALDKKIQLFCNRYSSLLRLIFSSSIEV